jgi:hypothetical protein
MNKFNVTSSGWNCTRLDRLDSTYPYEFLPPQTALSYFYIAAVCCSVIGFFILTLCQVGFLKVWTESRTLRMVGLMFAAAACPLEWTCLFVWLIWYQSFVARERDNITGFPGLEARLGRGPWGTWSPCSFVPSSVC